LNNLFRVISTFRALFVMLVIKKAEDHLKIHSKPKYNPHSTLEHCHTHLQMNGKKY